MKKLVKYFVLATILLGLPMKANAQTSIETNNGGFYITSKLVESTTYQYPYAGKEFEMGPEKTVYYAVYYDGNGEVKYGKIIRDVDDFVLERVYLDGTYDEFTPPQLTKKQIQDFNEKYDPVQVKKRMLEKEKEMSRKSEEEYRSLVERNLVTFSSGKNYKVYTYLKPNKDVFTHFSGFFSDINYENTKEKAYTFKIDNVKNTVLSKLNETDLPMPLKVSLVPYECEEFSQGLLEYHTFRDYNNQCGLEIVLFNNKSVSMEKQFEIQFEKYLKEVQ